MESAHLSIEYDITIVKELPFIVTNGMILGKENYCHFLS